MSIKGKLTGRAYFDDGYEFELAGKLFVDGVERHVTVSGKLSKDFDGGDLTLNSEDSSLNATIIGGRASVSPVTLPYIRDDSNGIFAGCKGGILEFTMGFIKADGLDFKLEFCR